MTTITDADNAFASRWASTPEEHRAMAADAARHREQADEAERTHQAFVTATAYDSCRAAGLVEGERIGLEKAAVSIDRLVSISRAGVLTSNHAIALEYAADQIRALITAKGGE